MKREVLDRLRAERAAKRPVALITNLATGRQDLIGPDGDGADLPVDLVAAAREAAADLRIEIEAAGDAAVSGALRVHLADGALSMTGDELVLPMGSVVARGNVDLAAWLAASAPARASLELELGDVDLALLTAEERLRSRIDARASLVTERSGTPEAEPTVRAEVELRPSELAGTPLDDSDAYVEKISNVLGGAAADGIEIEMRDGSWRLVSGHPTPDGGHICVVTNLSRHKAMEAALTMEKVFPHIDFRREATVGHLLLDTDAPTGKYAKVNPPIRPREDVEYLWQALLSGDVDWVVSDHACCSHELKVGAEDPDNNHKEVRRGPARRVPSRPRPAARGGPGEISSHESKNPTQYCRHCDRRRVERL